MFTLSNAKPLAFITRLCKIDSNKALGVKTMNISSDLKIERIEDGRIILSGDINRTNVLDLVESFTEHPVPYYQSLEIDIGALQIESGLTLLTLTNTFGALAKRVSSLTVTGAPKTLYNSLYSTGLLSGDNAIRLKDLREETTEHA